MLARFDGAAGEWRITEGVHLVAVGKAEQEHMYGRNCAQFVRE
jgi:hypothetical protein